jgi:multidrug efflux pump subunit AcrA (membrane-fusion protein)
MKAQMRKVIVNRTANDESVIQSGLEAGEKVVIDGQSRLTIGTAVEIVPQNRAVTAQAEALPTPPPRQP